MRAKEVKRETIIEAWRETERNEERKKYFMGYKNHFILRERSASN
jgi:hypothetical protein